MCARTNAVAALHNCNVRSLSLKLDQAPLLRLVFAELLIMKIHANLDDLAPDKPRLGGKPPGDSLPDAELLELFVASDDRAALEAIIRRYSGLVATVCRMTVSDPAAAEDAFQATFLILIKSAHKIRARNSLAAWLHGVAYRTACRIRKSQKFHSSEDTHEPEATAMEPIESLARQVEVETLNQELEKLPTTLRCPLVEHYMLGRTASAIADSLDVSQSAVEGRIRRGRRLLRRRLACRGISMSIVVAGSNYLQRHVIASDTAAWTDRLIESGLSDLPAPGGDATIDNEAFSREVTSLVKKEVSMFGPTTLKIAASTLLLVSSGAVIANLAQQSTATQFGQNGDGVSMNAPAWPDSAEGAVEMPPAANQPPVVAQMGMGGMGGGMGGINPSKPQAPTAEQTVIWQRPEDAGPEAGLPSWLEGGASAETSTENNRAKLNDLVAIEATRAPLQDFIRMLADSSGTSLRLNRQELESFGIEPDLEVLFAKKGEMTLREALRIVLEPEELAYRVTESGIEITSIDDANARPSLRYYDLAYVLPNSANAEALVNAIQTSVRPDDWMPNGGTATISLVGSMMIVTANDLVHQDIESVLLNIRRMHPSNASTPVAISGDAVGGVQPASQGGGMF